MSYSRGPEEHASDRATVLAWAADFAEEVAEKLRAHHEFERSNGALDVMTELRRLAAEAQPEPGLYRHFKGGTYDVVATAQHTETREQLVVYRSGDAWWCRPVSSFASEVTVDGELRPRFAPAAGVRQPDTETPCGPAPDQCDAEAGEPCADHERQQAHAEGEHAFCEPECSEAEPTTEDIVREHVTTLHLIGEQLAAVESWMWNHLADVRDAAPTRRPAVGDSGEETP